MLIFMTLGAIQAPCEKGLEHYVGEVEWDGRLFKGIIEGMVTVVIAVSPLGTFICHP